MQTIINTFGIVLSLLTATGVFIHDGRIDRATTATAVSVSRPTHTKFSFLDLGLAGGDHTHPEHSRRGLNGFTYKTPNFPPREQSIKRHLMQLYEPRGHHPFDNYHLPIVDA